MNKIKPIEAVELIPSVHGTFAANALDVSDILEEPSEKSLSLLARQLLKAKETGTKIIVPLITNKDTVNTKVIRKQVEKELFKLGANRKDAKDIVGQAYFDKFTITGKELESRQAVNPLLEIDSEAVYDIVQERIKAVFPGINGHVPVQILTTNYNRFKQSWREGIKLQLLAIISPTHVIPIGKQTAQAIEKIRRLLQQA